MDTLFAGMLRSDSVAIRSAFLEIARVVAVASSGGTPNALTLDPDEGTRAMVRMRLGWSNGGKL